MKKVALLTAATLLSALALTGCSSSDSSGESSDSTTEESTTETADSSNEAGFEEYPVGEDQEVGPLNVAVVYFQPIDMEPAGVGLAAADANFHIEADISALADNELGYGEGDFVPGLTVDYSFTDTATGEVVDEGTFMEMNASDGPHYGGNVALPDAGVYTLTLTIHSPEENGWVLHVDSETGVTGRWWTEPLVDTREWDYTPPEW